ncbi:MAG: dienelactone hydrolase family protein [Acidobacteriia bacterium]|nr:dienelactone hydrolase family protein [Terriglobia bacterium]
MKTLLALVLIALGVSPANAQTKPAALPDGVTAKEVKFFSEAVQCYAKIFTPKGFTADGKAPAIVLAPTPGETAASIGKYAAQMAGRGLVAMTIDYRGWGRSGGFLYLAEPLRWDDRLRFSQHTATVRIRRKRVIPDAQVQDIRNAISYLQGEPGVDRARIGVWGADVAGGHAMTVAAIDSRVKAVVAQAPIINGKDVPRKAAPPPAERQAEMVRLARHGQAPATPAAAVVMNSQEAKLALAEYHPFWFVDQIPQATAVLFVVAEKDLKVNNDANAVAAAKALKGPNGVTSIPGASHTMSAPAAFGAAVDAAAAWFQKHL